MSKRIKFQASPVTQAISAVSLILAAQAAHAGPGFGDAYDLNNNPFLIQSYFASSPAGARQWVGGAPGGYDPSNAADYANAVNQLFPGGYPGTGTALRKFVDPLPLLGAASAKPLADGSTSKYIPVAAATKWVNPQGATTNDDYFEIACVEYSEKFHSDLKKATTLRGYVQIDHLASNGLGTVGGSKALYLYYPNSSGKVAFANTADAPADAVAVMINGVDNKGKLTGAQVQARVVDEPHYLGPAIVATQHVPSRLKFYNLLPVGRAETETVSRKEWNNTTKTWDDVPTLGVKMGANGLPLRHGDLFLPVDPSIVGAGLGPDGVTQYTQNRISVHLHGGDTPWISDGTPHQWFTPAGEADPAVAGSLASDTAIDPTLLPGFLRGPSAVNVPDMNDPGPGAQTLYFPNGQAARLLWYHDHALGLTRLNVMAGMAAPFVLTDATEAGLINSGQLPDAAHTIPLVLQEKSFVPDDIALQDARWSTTGWGAPGDMWYPHVYETVQDPNQATNFNAVGRWHWGPWFWPVFPALYQLPSGAFGDATTVPEAWGDTPVINGTAYPTVTVDPQPYRFRILNASNDRFFTFNFFVADANQAAPFDANNLSEVKMVPVTNWNYCAPGVTRAGGAVGGDGSNCVPEIWNTDIYGHNGGVPDPATQGPTIYQFASEGGLLPGVARKEPTPISYLLDKGRAAVLGVDVATSGLQLGNAERADVVVDFSCFGGKTLIAYNDGGAPVPAADPRNEYFTGYGDNSATGGAEDTLAGYGPNTRTLMQVKVNAGGVCNNGVGVLQGNTTAEAAFDTAIKAAYKASQETPIVAQSAYNAALGTNWDDSKAFASIFTGSLKQPTFDFVQGTTNTDGHINAVLMSAKGDGYVTPPTVTMPAPTGANGVQATAEATLKIDKLHVVNGGTGYKVAPVVSIVSLGKGNGAGATATLKVSAVQVTNGGSGYGQGAVLDATVPVLSGGVYTPGLSAVTLSNAAPATGNVAVNAANVNSYAANATFTVSVTPPTSPTGRPAVASVVTRLTGNGVNQRRRIVGINIIDPGSGYTSAPTITIVAAGTTYRAANVNGVSTAVVAPTVDFTASSTGVKATGVATLTGSAVSAITVTNGGSGYTAVPTVNLVGGSYETGNVATAGAVTAVSTLPVITFPAPLGQALAADGITKVAGTRATGVAQVNAAGVITGVTITEAGSGYTVAPTPVVSSGLAKFSSTASVGHLMLDVPDPTNPESSGGGGYDNLLTLATAGAGQTAGLTITIAAPTTAGGTTATAGASGKIFDVTLTNSGAGYSGTVQPLLSAPVANPALATATPAQTLTPASTQVADVSAVNGKGSILVKTKAIQELFEPTYGRLNATLGIEVPFTSALTQTTIPLAYVDAPTEKFGDNETQIWKITHNGVDTHPVHFHLLNVQLVNRVGWDNFVSPPEPNELGWKETVKMSPLEDVIVAVRAKKPKLGGFGLPNSFRLQDPSQPEGAMTGFTQIDPNTGLPAPQFNQWVDYGWEYVWHCHILGHEENDFMRPVVFDAREVAPAGATSLTAVQNGTAVDLTWNDVATTEFQYQVQRAPAGSANWTTIANVLANATQFSDTTAGANASYQYQVVAVGQNGNGTSNTAVVMAPPAAPSGLTVGTVTDTTVPLTWADNANNESGYVLTRTGGATGTVTFNIAANATSFNDTGLVANTLYSYSLVAVNAGGNSAAATTSATTAAAAAPLPSNFTAARVPGQNNRVQLSWNDIASNTGYNIQYSTNGGTTWTTLGTAGNGIRLTQALTANSATAQVRSLQSNRTYKFQIQATGPVNNAWVVLPTNVIVNGNGGVTVQ